MTEQLDLFTYQAQIVSSNEMLPQFCQDCGQQIPGAYAHPRFKIQITCEDCHDAWEARQQEQTPARLNGFYYEESTGRFVSFVLGRRHFETEGSGYPADWKKRMKQERAIE